MLDREYIAMLARDGLIEVRDGVYRVCVLYMTRRQHDEYMSILSDSISIELKQMIYAKFEGYARDMLRRLPKFIDKNERNMRMMGFENFAPVLYYLIKMMADKHKRISVIVHLSNIFNDKNLYLLTICLKHSSSFPYQKIPKFFFDIQTCAGIVTYIRNGTELVPLASSLMFIFPTAFAG